MKTLGTLAAIVLGFTLLTWAQTVSTSEIKGAVQDETGLAVPGAEVRATQTGTGAARTTVTGADGSYVLSNLPVGPYQLEVSKQGFAKMVQTGIVLQVASNPTLDFSLKVGSVSEQVQVEANATMVETQNTGVGAVIDSQRVLDLPLVGRQVSDLIALSGGASVGATSGTVGFIYPNITSFSIAGGTQTGTTYLLDGAMHNDVFAEAGLPLPFPDALQEFKVETSALPAQYGFHAGGAVNAITRSGTNDWHGSAFEFLRNYDLNGRQFFAKTPDFLKRNQYGGTFGGPIRKNKLFFFAAFQETDTRQSPTAAQSFVPTADMLKGDFTTFASPACQAQPITLKDPKTNQPFLDKNKIPATEISQVALNISKYLPQPVNSCGLTYWGNPIKSGEHFGVAKVDYQLSPTHTMFARYLGTQLNQAHPYDLSHNVLSSATPGVTDLVQSLTLGDTYLIGPHIVNSARVTLDRSGIQKIGADFFGPADVGINMYTYLPKYTSILMTQGGFSIGGLVANNGTFKTTVIQLGDDLGVVAGNHQMSFGANISGWQSNDNSNTYSSGLFTITGAATNSTLSDFMTGNVFSLTQGAPNFLYVTQYYLGLYAQDSWKIRPGLTLNYGVRWEPYFPQHFGHGTVDHFDLNSFINNVKTTQFTNAPPGLFFPGDAGFPGDTGQYRQWKQWAPRVGLVWDPTGSGKTSIRASYGIFYDITTVQLSLATGQGPPWGGKVNPINPPGGLANPYPPGGDPFPFNFNKDVPFPLNGTMDAFAYNTHPPYVQQWNLSVQRQIGKDWLVSASYLGNEMVHLYGAVELNPAIYIPGQCGASACSTTANTNQRRLLTQLNPNTGKYYGFLDQWDDGGTSSYNGLLLSANKRFSRSFTLTANYTWSHCIGDPVNQFLQTNNGGGGVYQYPTRAGDRGNCSTSAIDQRHLANMTAVAEMPKFSGAWMQRLASGWRASTTVAMASGPHSSVNSGLDNALTGKDSATQPPDLKLSNVYVAPGTKSALATPAVPFLNRNAFGQPLQGTLGNLGPGVVEDPGSLTVNAGLSRLFHVRERHTFEIRAEAQNLLNRANFAPPNLTLNTNTFGYITITGPARIMQFAFKYSF